MPTPQTFQEQPLITFIVTTYNLEPEFLKESLNSIMALSLTKSQREIILIDDGSDVSPLNDISNIQDEIIYVRQPNQGVSVARNLGIKIASGKFIQFVDGDDSLIQAEYEHCLDIVRYHEPVDMVSFYLSKSKNQPVDFSYEGPMTGVKYMENNNIRASVCGYIFRTNCLGNLRFSPGTVHGEDEEFTPQLLLRVHNLYTTSSKAYFYRKRDNSVSHDKSASNIDSRLDDTLQVILRLRKLALDCEDGDKKEALSRRVAQLSMDYLVNVIRLTRKHKKLDEAINVLTEHNLFPLPDKRYTKKYVLFNHLIKNKVGKIILMTLL